MTDMESALQRDIESIEVFQDAQDASALLQDHGIAIALRRNLAAMENLLQEAGTEYVHRLTDQLYKIAEASALDDILPIMDV